MKEILIALFKKIEHLAERGFDLLTGTIIGILLAVIFIENSEDEQKMKPEVPDQKIEYHQKSDREQEDETAPDQPKGYWYEYDQYIPMDDNSII